MNMRKLYSLFSLWNVSTMSLLCSVFEMSQLCHCCELFSVSASQSYIICLKHIMFTVFEICDFCHNCKIFYQGMYILCDMYIPSMYYTVIMLRCKVLRNVRYTLLHKIYTLWQKYQSFEYIRSCIILNIYGAAYYLQLDYQNRWQHFWG